MIEALCQSCEVTTFDLLVADWSDECSYERLERLSHSHRIGYIGVQSKEIVDHHHE